MSELITLKTQKREQTGKGAARKLRTAGRTPAVFYTREGKNICLSVNEKELGLLYAKTRRTQVFNVEISENGSTSIHPALIWDVDYFPVKNRIQHVDILGVELEREIKIRVPLEFTGTAKGIKIGGQLEIYREHVPVIGKPLDIPQKIRVDISDLDINNFIYVKDLALPAGTRVDMDSDAAVAAVLIVRETNEQETAEADTAAPAAE
ncbi:MAG: 50S ribosomal protein L25 [Deltaproteobacteria bacterium]|jgi:large subunit ribosomal protein L25|nr:50S ribosomal protein L25 [Deltaproteobacteria bacterium]